MMTTPYIIKIPMVCSDAKTTMTNTTQCVKSMLCTPQTVAIELPPVTIKPQTLHMVTRETTRMVMEQVEWLINEPCIMQACKKTNGQHACTLITIITATFNKYKEKFYKNKHPMCPECADKVKRSFLGEKVVCHKVYKETTTELSTCIVAFIETYNEKKGQDAEDLCNILYDTMPTLWKAILDTPNNHNLLWWLMDWTDAALWHFRLVILAEERNWLMHVENGNCGPNHYHPYVEQHGLQCTRCKTPPFNTIFPGVPDESPTDAWSTMAQHTITPLLWWQM